MAALPVIDNIHEKLERLINDNRRLRAECDKIAEQRDKLKVHNTELSAEIDRMEKRITVLELKDSLAGDSDNAKLAKARVNRLMREVNKCIALLNR